MPRLSDNECWVPFLATEEFYRGLLASDVPRDENMVLMPSPLHSHAASVVLDLALTRASFWGDPDSGENSKLFLDLNRAVVKECPSYTDGFIIANLTYYLGNAAQFMLVVQVNPVYCVDMALVVGQVELQASLFFQVLAALTNEYEKRFPDRVEDSAILKYSRRLTDALVRVAISDQYNPLGRESLQLERLRELCGGRVSIVGGYSKWEVRDSSMAQVASSSDPDLAIMDAVTIKKGELNGKP